MKLYLHPIFYGSKPPDIRFESRNGQPIYFCRNNRTLHLTEREYDGVGTLQAGGFLQMLCGEFCVPARTSTQSPCPAFVEGYDVFSGDASLARVTPRRPVRLDLCLGVQKLLEFPETPEERFFLEAYLRDHVTDELTWRNELVEKWNMHCPSVKDGWMDTSRRAKFDDLMWATVRFPALIPQVWLNWLSATPREKALDENPSRVDFIAIHHGERHLIEIDGPSHYAAYREATRTYTVDERAYARNLKIARSLEREGWWLTRIARIEVRDAMPRDGEDESDFAVFTREWDLVRILPFAHQKGYPAQPSWSELGLPEIGHITDDIPF